MTLELLLTRYSFNVHRSAIFASRNRPQPDGWSHSHGDPAFAFTITKQLSDFWLTPENPLLMALMEQNQCT